MDGPTVRTRRSLSERTLNTSTPNNSPLDKESLKRTRVILTRKRARSEENEQQNIQVEQHTQSRRKNGINMQNIFQSETDMVHSSAAMLPLRRSKREKRLIYANFTPNEIKRTITNQQINLLDPETSEEEELEPYEKLLSPIAKKMKKIGNSQHGYSTRSSTNSNLTEVRRSVGNTTAKRSANDREDIEGLKIEDGEDDEEEEKDKEDDNEEEEEEEEEEDDDDEEEEEEEEASYYNLRKRRPVVYQYQPVIQVVDKESRKKTTSRHKSSFPYRSAAYQPRKEHSKKKYQHKAHQDSTTSSSEDSDEERFKRRKKRSMKRSRMECLPMNFTAEDMGMGSVRDRARIGTSLADISPMNVDRSITFDSVGGLREHITALKEMIVFPLMYPEVFDKFKINPPRGVLFHGPPGCGKTLVARALANECSRENRKIAFFMRKGADCLSKWVGESERQLRLLFDQAYQMRPSILFFDEIDGLAPIRSTRQDQIHSSIVSTLLALMDGLDSRGEIVVIGATNRIDSIDPALRRPGRFDREFIFPLPTRQDRHTILKIHTNSWNPPLHDQLLDELSELTVGYCGADLKALCTEAAMHSLRHRYPQIYESSDRLVIDVSKLTVSGGDFFLAYKDIVPTGHRSNTSVSKPLSDIVFPLIGVRFEALLKQLVFVFPQSWKCVRKGLEDSKRRQDKEKKKLEEIKQLVANNADYCVGLARSLNLGIGERNRNSTNNQSMLFSEKIEGVFFDLKDSLRPPASPDNNSKSADHHSNVQEITTHPHLLPNMHRPRLLLTGSPGMGQSNLLSLALLHACEDVPLKLLDTPTILGSVSQTPEEVCIQVFREASRVVPCIVYIPRIVSLWEVMSASFKVTFRALVDSLSFDLPLLLLATAECRPDDLPDDLVGIFPVSSDNCYVMPNLSTAERESFFFEILLKEPLKSPPKRPTSHTEVSHEPLPLAPPPLPRKLSEVETNRIIKHREAVLRELRVFLRETTNRLLAERKFKEFTKSVNPEEVPDYYDIISNPMDLSTIMKRIDEHMYSVPKQWLKDIDLITSNALEYNPEHDTDSRLLRHRALALQDLAHSIFDHELDEEFEKQCEDIEDAFQRLKNGSGSPSKQFNASMETVGGGSVSDSSSMYVTPRCSMSRTPFARGQTTSSDSYDVRRSLRRLGCKPDSDGLPYYAPPKPRTPRKDDDHESTATDDGKENAVKNTTVNLVEDDDDSCAIDMLSTASDKPLSLSIRRLSFDEFSKKRSNSPITIGSDRQDGRRSLSSSSTSPFEECVIVEKAKLVELFGRIVRMTEGYSVDQCLKVHSTLSQLVFRHRMDWNKSSLLEELQIAAEHM